MEIFVNINNEYGYPDEVFDITLEHLSGLLISTKMTPDELHDDLELSVENVLETYNPKFHENMDDYVLLADIENRFFQAMSDSKDLLNEVLGNHPELRYMYMQNIRDVDIKKLSGNWGLLQVTIDPPGGETWKQTIQKS
ncbi:hypothetical protein FDJ25_gp085 [Vibrio phage Aphrodite1]|nr:hypothetical protein FDJ25_gp085 [Vibrio phage Aphrodite1]AUR81065.1 hypothetical protein Aphrodite1_0118 [Vibrio phage Aphrodite1]QCW23227.1 hypothetical protein [Vibrio phage 5 TSL-2019]